MTEQTKKRKIYEKAIINWPKDERPREKLLKHGEHALTNAELLAILVRTGTSGKSAVDIAREILRKFKTLRAISSLDVINFRQISGLKDAKIAQIKAAAELGRRMMSEEKAFPATVKSSENVIDYLMPLMRDLTKESFKILLLDKKNSVADVIDIAIGTIDRVNPSIRSILETVIKYQVPTIIIVHNHPSGNIEPSDEDKILTRDLIIAGTAMGLRIFDHIIIGNNQHFSFADEGLIEEYEMQTVNKL